MLTPGQQRISFSATSLGASTRNHSCSHLVCLVKLTTSLRSATSTSPITCLIPRHVGGRHGSWQQRRCELRAPSSGGQPWAAALPLWVPPGTCSPIVRKCALAATQASSLRCPRPGSVSAAQPPAGRAAQWPLGALLKQKPPHMRSRARKSLPRLSPTAEVVKGQESQRTSTTGRRSSCKRRGRLQR